MSLSAAVSAQTVVNAVFPDSTLLFYQGREDGVRAGDVYEVLRDDFVIGRVVVTEAERLYSFARITVFTMPIRRGDRLRKVGPAMLLPEIEPLRSVIMFGEREAAGGRPAVSEGPEPGTGVLIEEKTRKRIEEAENPLKIKFDGSHYVKYRTFGASGATGTFISDSGLLLRGQTIEQGTNLTIEATYKDSFKLGGNIYQMPLQERELLFNFEAGNIKATMGDFPAEFRTGKLSPLTKKVSGGEVLYTTNKLDASALFSEAKSYKKTQSFSGNGTYGPYRINAVEILSGSETIQINGETIAEDEYQIDYFIGKITFCSRGIPPECRVISESDRVQVTYEQRLLLALRGEGVTGMGAAYRPGKKFLKEVAFSFISEDAASSEQQILVEGTYSIATAGLSAQTAGTVRWMPDGADPKQMVVLPIPEYSRLKDSGYLFLKPGFEIVKQGEALLSSGTDYKIYYAEGAIQLFSPATATITVKYVYYDHDLVFSKNDEEILDELDLDGLAFQLSKFTIYSGTEIVKECTKSDDPCDVGDPFSCSDFSSSYTINDNRIIFKPDVISILSSKRICMAYYYVPSAPPSASRFDHAVLDVTTSWDFGELLGFNYEFAKSEADVSKTPIQVVRERVTPPFERSVTCPSEDFSNPCIYPLRNGNIIEGTEKITVSTSDVPFLSGSEYFLEIDTGTVRFTNATFATGTVVYADYQYNP
ncbi:MAG: hypothetical protein ABIH66_06330, partial [bacterium]